MRSRTFQGSSRNTLAASSVRQAMPHGLRSSLRDARVIKLSSVEVHPLQRVDDCTVCVESVASWSKENSQAAGITDYVWFS